MNLQSFEQEVQDWLDGSRSELSEPAQKFRHENTEAEKLYSHMCALQHASRNMMNYDLGQAAASAIKSGVWKELDPDTKRHRLPDFHFKFNLQSKIPLATAFAAALIFVIWLWPRLNSPVQDQDYEFYFEQHKLASGDMLAAE